MPPALQFTATANDAQLDRKIIEYATFTGRTVKSVGEEVIKGLIKDVLDITPPASGRASKAAQRAGEGAIVRDLSRMGIVPVEIKGYREVTTVYGHRLDPPVRVKTKRNPRFEDPAAIHQARIQSKHGGRVTRGSAQAYYVPRAKYGALRTKLFKEVGRLAAAWIRAADRFGVSVPAWIRRHAGDHHGGEVQVSYDNGIKFRAVSHFPATAEREASHTQRQIEFAKVKAVRKLRDRLNALLKKGWRKS